MTKKVEIQKFKAGESAFTTVCPDYLKKYLSVHDGWEEKEVVEEKEVEKGVFKEVCTCLSKNKEEFTYHTTVSENGQCILCDYYTFEYELKLNRKIVDYTKEEILKIKEKRELICPIKIMNCLNKFKLNVGKVANSLELCEIKLDNEIVKFRNSPCGVYKGVNVKRFYINIILVEEILRLAKKYKLVKDQALEFGTSAKVYSRKVTSLNKYFPWLKKELVKIRRKHG